jgi:hypothetical protein
MRKAWQEFNDEMAGLRERDRMMMNMMSARNDTAVPPPDPKIWKLQLSVSCNR